MLTRVQERVERKHIVVCLLLLFALLGMSVASASHIHRQTDVHEGQCAMCISCAHMVAVCAAVVVALMLALVKDESVFACEFDCLTTWIPPAQRVRPPPTI
jgi:uncharacterized membrane protein